MIQFVQKLKENFYTNEILDMLSCHFLSFLLAWDYLFLLQERQTSLDHVRPVHFTFTIQCDAKLLHFHEFFTFSAICLSPCSRE